MSQSSGFNEIYIALDALRRRRRIFVIIVFCGLLATMFPVMLLPSVYQSTATILIESQEIPTDLVRTTVTGFVEERLKSITQITLNRVNLMGMIEKLNLYEKERKKMTSEEIVEKMRSDIAMVPIQADVQGSFGRPMAATIAFTLSYKNRVPSKSLQTANMLVSLFLEENYKSREAKATTTYSFLENQITDQEEKITKIEDEIARFKEEHINSLPEMLQLNLQTLERIQKDIDYKKELIRTITDRKIYLESQLTAIDPSRPFVGPDGRSVLSPHEELKMLRNQYISLSATLTEKHPDIINLRQKIAALETATGNISASTITDLEKSIRQQSSLLNELRGKYSESHPDVILAEKRLAAFKQQLDETKRKRKNNTTSTPDNPTWITLNTQLKTTDLELTAEKNNLVDLQKKYEEYIARIEESPQVEQDFRKLQRDYNIAQTQYHESMSKLIAAKEAKVLEEQRAGERLTLIDPPVMPETPISPNRKLIFAAGCMLSIFMAGGTIALLELLNSTIHGSRGLAMNAKLPVLVTIPYYATRQENIKNSRQKKIIFACGVLMLLGMVALAHFVFMPLDVIIYTIMNKVSASF